MSTYLDIETYRHHDEEAGGDYVEWTTVKLSPWVTVSINRESASPRRERRVDPAAGISLNAQHLDALIDALVRLRADLTPACDEQKERGT
jgi:hypothetical protein